MGLFTKKRRCALDGKLYPESAFRNSSERYTRNNDNLRRMLNRYSGGTIGVSQVRRALITHGN